MGASAISAFASGAASGAAKSIGISSEISSEICIVGALSASAIMAGASACATASIGASSIPSNSSIEAAGCCGIGGWVTGISAISNGAAGVADSSIIASATSTLGSALTGSRLCCGGVCFLLPNTRSINDRLRLEIAGRTGFSAC